MAGWFPMDLDLEDKPKFKVIMERLGLDEHEFGPLIVAGALRRFWAWMDKTSNDGFLALATAKMIDRTVGVKGFSEALCAVGWLEIDDAGATMPGFEENHSSSSKKRVHDAREAARKRKQDGKPQPAPIPAPIPDQTPNLEGSRDDCDESREGRDENRGDRDLHRQNRQTDTTSTSKRARGAAAAEGDEREKIRSEGGEWSSLIAPLVDSGVIYAAKAIRAGQKRLTPPKVRELIAVFQANRDRLPDPGTLVTRIETGGTDDDPLSGWGRPVSPPAKQRGPTFYDLLDDLERDLDRRGVKGEERVRQIDAFYERHGKQAGPTLEGTAA